MAVNWARFEADQPGLTAFMRKIHSHEISKEDLAKEYDNWSKAYEQTVGSIDFRGPTIVSDKVAEVLTDRSGRVLDLGAGTGIVGEKLKQHGFTHIDGLDGSPKMLELAKEKGVYDNLICAFITEDTQMPIKDNTYSALVLSAGISPGHITGSCFPEMARVVKPGGLIVLAIDELYFEDPVFGKSIEEPLEAVQKNGTVTLLQRNSEPNYVLDINGTILVMKVN